MNTSELRTKLQKYSATQLISKMEKGVENEEEKNIIIDILVKRGKDVTPYQDKTSEQIKDDSKIDQKMKKESKSAEKKEKAEKPEKVKTQKEGKSKKEIFYDDEVFAKGVRVKILNDSKKVPAGTEGIIAKTGYPESRPDDHFAYIKIEIDGKKTTCGRMLRFLEIVK